MSEELKTPADIEREERMEAMDEIRTQMSLVFDDAVEDQARKVGYNVLTQFGVPKDASAMAYYITLAVTSTVLWAVADGWLDITEKGKADELTHAKKMAKVNERRKKEAAEKGNDDWTPLKTTAKGVAGHYL